MSQVKDLFEEKNYEAVIEGALDFMEPGDQTYVARAYLQQRQYEECKETLLRAFNLCGGDVEAVSELSRESIDAIFAEVVTVAVTHVQELLATYQESGEKAPLIASAEIWPACSKLLTEVAQRGDLIGGEAGKYHGLAEKARAELVIQTATAYAESGEYWADFIVADFTADRETATTTEAGMAALAWFMGLNEKAKSTGVILETGAGLLDIAIGMPQGDARKEQIAQQYKRIIGAQVKLIQLRKMGVSGKDVYFWDEGSTQRQEAVNKLTKFLIQIKKVEPEYSVPGFQTPKGGCYVATCVYGSYDCPQVWRLRRFRDETLDETLLGRLFIRLYYAVSPGLVKLFGRQNWFRKLCRGPLDRLVRKLEAEGVSDSPYNDKY